MYATYLLFLSFIICCILIYIVYNLYKKTRVYENWIIEIKNDVNLLNLQIKEIDSRGIFEKDDDVGVIYEEIKELITSFNEKVQD
tara:strand:+ start:423 stop:677 length:255 start_codon:yes stop_codon:yes gene_type:complete